MNLKNSIVILLLCFHCFALKTHINPDVFVRTENQLGPGLSLTFESFVNGPAIDGEDCELHQVEQLLQLDLTPFTLMNYSGLLDESNFPGDSAERAVLINKQMIEDQKWNSLKDFRDLITQLISAIENGKLNDKVIQHQYDWWMGYFDVPKKQDGKDYFIRDLRVIKQFLNKMEQEGETNMAFYTN